MPSEILNGSAAAPSQPSATRQRLAARIRAARQAIEGATLIPARGEDDPDRLSFAEEQLWYVEQFLKGTPTYNISRAWRILGPLDRTALRSSVDQLVARHASLRTTVASSGAGATRVVHPAGEAAWRAIDAAATPRENRAAEATRLAREAAVESLSLHDGPLVRFTLVTFDAEDHVFAITLHHIIADGWSLGLMLRELAALYRARTGGVSVDLRLPPREYADFAAWQHDQARAGALEASLAYWENKLKGAPTVLDLPTDRPRPAAPTHRGALAHTLLPPTELERIHTWSATLQASAFVVLLAAFKVLLHRLSGEDDLVVGSPFASRVRPELEPIVGYFANMLPLRTSLADAPSFREVVRRVRDTVQEAVDRQEVPFATMVERLRPTVRHAGLNPIFQTAFVLESQSLVGAPQLADTRAESILVETGTSKFDLSLLAVETERGLNITIEASADLFDASTAARLLTHYRALVEHLMAAPDEPIAAAPMMSPEDQQLILNDWSGTTSPYPRTATVHELFAEVVRRNPEAPALTCGTRTLTYGALDQASNRMARRLREGGVRPGDFVVIGADRSIEFVVSILSIVKAGAAYVPLDVRHPKSWISRILEDVQPSMLVVARQYLDVIPPSNAPVLPLDDSVLSVGPEPVEAPESSTTATSAAYAMFTSGSTGVPKGTIVPHRAIVRLVRGTNYVPFAPDDTFLLMSNLAFDASTLEQWGPLLNGGRLVIPEHPQPTLAQIADTVRRHHVSTLFLTTGLFNLMVEECPEAFVGVKHLLTGGEIISVAHVAKAMAVLQHTQLSNVYGPTENTVFTTWFPITAGDVQKRCIPIGRPIANTRVYILDAQRRPVPVGIPGELYTGGDGVADGYLNRPELTEERFVPDPFSHTPGARMYRTGDRCRWRHDGTIEFLGRIDQEIKIRGFRVDPGEIEATLSLLPGVAEAAVVPRTRSTGEKELLGFVVAANGASLVSSQLREQLAARVPLHMVPSSIAVIGSMPLTTNGKVDRRTLAALPRDAAPTLGAGERVGPRNDTERRLERLWCALLNCEHVDVREDFFAIGGHSLLAMRLMHRIQEEFGQALPIATLLSSPTIEQLAARLNTVAAPEPVAAAPDAPVLRGSGPGAPLFFIPGMGGYEFLPAPVARALDGCCPFFDGLQMVGVDRQAAPLEDLRAIAADLIRQIRAVRPRGPYSLCGYCYGGVVAFEVARQLEEAGETIEALVIWHGYPIHKPWPRRTVPQIARAVKQRFLETPAADRPRMLWDKATLAVRMLGWKISDHWNLLRGRPRTLIPHNLFFPDVMDPEVVFANLRARGRYVPTPYRGRVFLLLGETDRLLYECPPLAGWDGVLLGPVQVFQHPVEHMELVVPPTVDLLAAQTAGCLAAAHQRVTARPARGFAAVQ